MEESTKEELAEALKVVVSTISNCEKILPKFSEGTSQHTLLQNRIKALYISKALITEKSDNELYSKEELNVSLNPIVSIINKCVAGQRKHEMGSVHYKRFQKIIDAMSTSKTLILDEIGRRG